MAVTFDAGSESHTGAAGSVSQASFNWSHVGSAATKKGALVFVMGFLSSADDSTAVTYGSANLAVVSGGFAVDTAGEPMTCRAWFVGDGVPTGTQTITVTRNNNVNEMWAVGITVEYGLDTSEVYVPGIVLLQEDGTLAEQNVDDGSPGTTSQRFAGMASGLAAFPPTGASSTAIHDIDIGTKTGAVVRRTSGGQGSLAVGFASGTLDDRAGVHLAVREIAAGAEFAQFHYADRSIYPGPTNA